MAKANPRKTPSRIKYEQSNPTVSFRVSRELYDRLQAVKKTEGKSNTDILKVALGLIEVKVRAEKELGLEAYDEGWEKGVNSSWDVLAVTYPCSKCGKEITVDTEEEKRAIKTYMRKYGWGHTKCINQRY
jgi:hypothetical protein